MRRRRKLQRVDPFMQDVPFDIIRNDKGKVLAEVFQLPTEQLNDGMLKRKKKHAK
jgi:hypothetical protein